MIYFLKIFKTFCGLRKGGGFVTSARGEAGLEEGSLCWLIDVSVSRLSWLPPVPFHSALRGLQLQVRVATGHGCPTPPALTFRWPPGARSPLPSDASPVGRRTSTRRRCPCGFSLALSSWLLGTRVHGCPDHAVGGRGQTTRPQALVPERC